jgi:hypothetical protein
MLAPMTAPDRRAWPALRRIPPEPAVRTLAELDDPGVREDLVLRLPRARVVLADLEALLHDFSALGPADEGARARAERWLLEQAAVVTATQAAQTVVNSPIPVDGEPRRVLRPTFYGRSVVVPVSGGLLDVKGTGVFRDRVPSCRRWRSTRAGWSSSARRSRSCCFNGSSTRCSATRRPAGSAPCPPTR